MPAGREPHDILQASPHIQLERNDRFNSALDVPFRPVQVVSSIPADVIFASRSAPLHLLAASNHTCLCRAPAGSPLTVVVRANQVSWCR